jgi:hypothetical protein
MTYPDKVLVVRPAIRAAIEQLEDWIRLTGFGETNIAMRKTVEDLKKAMDILGTGWCT